MASRGGHRTLTPMTPPTEYGLDIHWSTLHVAKPSFLKLDLRGGDTFVNTVCPLKSWANHAMLGILGLVKHPVSEHSTKFCENPRKGPVPNPIFQK
eukprot:5671133-Amphidinium_carterae.1